MPPRPFAPPFLAVVPPEASLPWVALAARWPSPLRILRTRGAAGAMALAKAWWRDRLSRPHQPVLLAALNRAPAWRGLFARDPRYMHCALSHFIDRRFDARQRFAAMATDLRAADRAFGADLARRLARRERVRLCTLAPDLHLTLSLNDMSYHEGLWALSLRDDAGTRLYYLSFAFRGERELLVPTLQGPGGQSEAARDTVRRLTKLAEGLRPPALLLAALRMLCDAWGVDRLLGIAPEHHVKGRWNLRGKRLRFDYTALWQEQCGTPSIDGHWRLPLAQAQRAMQDMPANKRAMYRRRYAMLDRMAVQIGVALGRPAEPLAAAA